MVVGGVVSEVDAVMVERGVKNAGSGDGGDDEDDVIIIGVTTGVAALEKEDAMARKVEAATWGGVDAGKPESGAAPPKDVVN